RGFHGNALVWLKADGAAPTASGLVRGPQTGSSADAQDRSVADLPATKDQRTASPASYLSLPAAASGDRAAGSGLVCRRDLHLDAAWLPLSRCHHGLVQPQGAGLAIVEHDGCRVLRCCPR